MNAIEIISKIRSAGGSIASDGEKLSVSIPPGVLDQADRIALAENKSTLVELLKPSQAAKLPLNCVEADDSDPEREAIIWADTPAADEALDQSRREWADIVSGWEGWPDISDEDLTHIFGPVEDRAEWEAKRHPGACVFCGGRTVHSKPCRELRRGWEPVLPWGKHKGERVSEAPKSYLGWLAKKDLPVDLKEAIKGVLAP